MPQRNFCDRCGEEIPLSDSYFTVGIVEVNKPNYGSLTTTITDGHTVPVQTDVDMMCRKCAKHIHADLYQ